MKQLTLKKNYVRNTDEIECLCLVSDFVIVDSRSYIWIIRSQTWVEFKRN